jgi:hypothetical protein
VAIGSRRTDVVKAVQYVANIAGIVPLSVDGDFGEITESAVRVFQKQAALAPTGKVDDATWQAMVDTASSRPALLKIQSVDPNVIVRIEAMAGTREIYEISNDSEISVPAGPYHVEVMLGGDLLNKTDLVLMPGQSRTIQTVAEQGEATTQLLSGVATPGRTAYQPSEAIGLIQGAVLPTLLPLIALKYFDCSNDILSHLNICVPALPPATDPSGYVAIAMALEGQWKESPAQVWQQVHVNWRTLGGPSQLESGGNFSAMSPISERVSTAFAKPGLGSCQVIVTVPELMELDIASCTTLRRATCIGLVLHADGRIRLTQSLLLPPGVEPELENRTIKPQRVARLLALAASIYADGSHSRTLTHPELVELEYGKWTDPLLGVLAWLSRNGLYGSPSWGVPKTDTDEVANNLARFFAGVPDVSVIQALRGHSDWSNLISNPSVSPLFAATARILSAEAIRRNRQDSPIVDRSRRLSSDSIWNVVVKPAASKVKNQENNHAEFPAK